MARSAQDLQLRELKDMITQLNKTISSLNRLLEAADQREQEHIQRETVLQEQIDYLTRKLFGASSERSKEDVPGQLNLFDEAEQEQHFPEEECPAIIKVQEHIRARKTTNEEKFKGLPVEQVVLELPEDERTCPKCGTELEVIGRETVRRELEFIPAKVKVIEYVSVHYGCPECKLGTSEDGLPTIVKAVTPEPLMKHSAASPSTVAWTMYQKYANGIPLYRQEKDWKQYGIELSRTTLANWIIYSAGHYFRPVYEYLHRELIKRRFLMADETRIQVLNEPERRPETDSFMWLYRSGEDGLETIILYGYTQTRSGDHAAEFLKGFHGYLSCDGYQGYNKVPDIIRCCCWTHVRRYLIDAVPKGKQYDYSNPAVQGVQFCNQLFHYEEEFRKKGYSHEKRKAMRLEKERPVLEAFWSWLDNQHPIRNSRMDKAVNYIRNRKPYLETYLEDGRCSFSNNLSENAIRPFTVGRKNWLFSNSMAGAAASAMVYTMVEMAKAHDLNIYKYLTFLLEQRPSMDMTDEQLAELVPWSQNARDACKTT